MLDITRPPVKHYLLIGGLVALGFDERYEYLLVVSHSGCGLFSTQTWKRIARCTTLSYPDDEGYVSGIGMLEGKRIHLTELVNETLHIVSPDGRFALDCESSGIQITL